MKVLKRLLAAWLVLLVLTSAVVFGVHRYVTHEGARLQEKCAATDVLIDPYEQSLMAETCDPKSLQAFEQSDLPELQFQIIENEKTRSAVYDGMAILFKAWIFSMLPASLLLLLIILGLLKSPSKKIKACNEKSV